MKRPGDLWGGERYDHRRMSASSVLGLAGRRRYRIAARWARGRTLEVGCGPGSGTDLIGGVGIDSSMDALRYARERYGVRAVNADARRLPFGASAFDSVVCLEVLEHVEEQEDLVRELARILRPGGVLVLSTPHPGCAGADRYPVSPFHIRERPPAEVRALLRPFFRLRRRYAHYLPLDFTAAGRTRVFGAARRTWPRAVARLLLHAGSLFPGVARFQVYVAIRTHAAAPDDVRPVAASTGGDR